jgi:two-component system, sensor histidine kinase
MHARIRAEQIRVLYRNAPGAVIGALVAAALLCASLRGAGGPPSGLMLGWLAFMLAVVIAHLALCRWFAAAHRPDDTWWPWARRFVAVSLVEGCIWGAGAISISQTSTGVRQITLIGLMLVGVSAGGVVAYGSYLPALCAFVLPIVVSYVLFHLALGEPLQQAMALYFGLFAIIVLPVAQRTFTGVIVQSLRVRFENLDLLHALRIEKDRSEQASLDKSRFLAASSHDLRQPVHALGMFVAALRGRGMDGEARRLVGHIENCLAGLKELFDSLLDISRLDAGAIEPRPNIFPVRPLLERICADYAANARAKGIALRLVSCSAHVCTDPVLLERILRNIVDNAVQHTVSGRVLVGCRRGGAARGMLRIQVSDTGPGIPPDAQERVFQEFVQLGNPERDRAKGLGLGLAIVRRLVRLLDGELVLRSVPGRGTMLEVSVPAAAVPLATSPDGSIAPDQAVMSAIRLRGTVLVVDDEVAILTAMQALLTGWGIDVLAAGSGGEMLALAAALRAPPALLICDWQLRDNEQGIAVIDSLRMMFNAEIPAVLLTGDVALRRQVQGRHGDVLLLHKPVAPGRLRAILGSLTKAV